MGHLRNLNLGLKKMMQDTRLMKLSKEGQMLYATVPLAPWQKKRIEEIREVGELKCAEVDKEATRLKRGIVEDFLEFELGFIKASASFRKNNPGVEWKPGVIWDAQFRARRFLKKTFSGLFPAAEPVLREEPAQSAGVGVAPKHG